MDVAAELRELATRNVSGCVDAVSGQVRAQVWLSEGRVHRVSLSSATPALGMRLVSGGTLSLTNLGAALALQQQHPGLRLGDALVRMGLASREDVEAVAWEQMCDRLAAVLALPEPALRFTPATSAHPPAPGPALDDVLAAARTRMNRLQHVVREVGGPDTVPSLTDALLSTRDASLRPEEWAVLCRVDGRRSLMSIAAQAGFTTLESALILQGLLAAGLVTVPTPVHVPVPVVSTPAPEPAPRPAPVAAPPAAASADLFDDPSALLRELSEIGGMDTAARRRGR